MLKDHSFGLVFKFTLILLFCIGLVHSQNLPVGYIEQYSNPCNSQSFFKSFVRSDSSFWKINSENGLKLSALNDSESVFSIGVLDQMIFGEYIMEFDFRVENQFNGLPAFSFLGSMKSKGSYYDYSFASDSIRFYFVNKGSKNKIDTKPLQKLKPGWNKAHIEWDILSRNTTIVINNNQSKKLVFNDNKLVMGYLGFANGFISSSIKNIKIWAPTCITDKPFAW